MSETKDYQTFRKHAHWKDRIDRVENIHGPGMPDINFCSNGVECWIEHKSPTEPVRDRTPLFGSNHKVSQKQKNWFLRQMNAGGRCYFLVTTNKRWMLLPGIMADIMNEMTVAEIASCSLWHAMKPVKNWGDLWKALRR